jgi:TPP-dependent pyruvate/acetoin dehydrogenase alpha subunit
VTHSAASAARQGTQGPTEAARPPARDSSVSSDRDGGARLRRADERLMGRPEEPRELRFYRRMRFIRRFEERLLAMFDEGILNGTTHACVGQEADCVGVIECLQPGDHIFSNHRCHGHYLAWTGDALGLMAEIMGKAEGVVSGLGGSQHVATGGFKSNGILGGTLPAAAGIALAMKLDASDAISVAFMGDGTFGEGVVYETLNIAALWGVPLLLVVENNGYSQSTPIAHNMAGQIAARFAAFGIPADEIDSTDVLAIEAAARRAVEAVRSQRRPQALIIDTYRLCHHSKSDDNRPAEEIAQRWLAEPLTIHGARLEEADRAGVDAEVEAALDEITAAARGGG